MKFLTEAVLMENEIWRFVVLFVVILLSLVTGRIARMVLQRRGEKLQVAGRMTGFSLVLRALARPIVFLFFLIGLRIGFLFLVMSPQVQSAVDIVVRIMTAITIGYMAYATVDVADHYITERAKRTKNKIDDMLAPLIRKSLRVTVVIIVGIFIAESLSDKPIATLITGLGVGGLAVALAAQDTLKNVLGSIVIMADKPFKIGERVVIGEHDGPVEEVGFRSTKIRTLEGHLVTVPNSDIVSTMVRNIGSRPYIRRLANITITYDTPPEKVDRAVEIIKQTLDNHEGMNPDFPPRVFFNEFNDTSLNILMIYWYHPPEYWKYLDFTERVNREILRRFNEEGIDFAFPTQTIHLANDDKRQLPSKCSATNPTDVANDVPP